MKYVAHNALTAQLEAVLRAVGAEPTVAQDTVRAAIQSSLAGVDTHGINLIPKILDRLRAKRTQVAVPAQITSQGPAFALLNGNLAPGQHTTYAAARLAAQKARETGVGYAAVVNSTHFGGATPFLWSLAEEGLVALVGSNSLRSMAAFGLRRANLGNNPFGFGAPRSDGMHFVFDFCCGVMSFGRRRQLKEEGKLVPDEAFVRPDAGSDDEGGVCEIADSLEELARPFGGFKGASVAMLVEFLAAVLPGGAAGAETETITRDGKFLGANHFVLALAPSMLGDGFDERATSYVEEIRRGQAIRLPGDRLHATRAERLKEGIPVSSEFQNSLKDACGMHNVAVPQL